MEAMAKHRTHSIAFKRQVLQEYLGGETMHGLAKRHDLSRNLIRIWVQKYEAGGLDEDVAAADMIQEYEARIATTMRHSRHATTPRSSRPWGPSATSSNTTDGVVFELLSGNSACW
jgi:transposase-like protein